MAGPRASISWVEQDSPFRGRSDDFWSPGKHNPVSFRWGAGAMSIAPGLRISRSLLPVFGISTMVVPPWNEVFESCVRTLLCARYRPVLLAAKALYLEIIRLAYNLVIALQRMCVPDEWQSLTLSKVRHRFFWLPGELSRPGNRPILWLGNSDSIRS